MRPGVLGAAILVVAAGARQQPQMVNNPAPNFRTPTLALAAKPAIVIDGNATGDSLTELFNVSDAALTPGRSLIVINNFGETIREFDPQGRFVRFISRKGEGPGEYRSISSLRILDGDTMVFFDGGQRRISVLGPDRRHARTITGVRRSLCCTMTGTFVDRESAPFVGGTGASYAASSYKYWFGSIRPSSEAGLAFSGDTAPQTNLPGYAAGVTFPMAMQQGRPVYVTYAMPFTIVPIAALGFDEWVLGTGEQFEYRVFDRRGTPIRVVRAAAAAKPLTDSIIRAFRADFTKVDPRNPELAGKKAAALDTLKLPKALPAYDRINVEEDGTVWVREYVASDTMPQPWARFDRQGKLLGTLVVPANFRTFRFSRGHLIGFLRDTTQDFQRVMVYPIVRK